MPAVGAASRPARQALSQGPCSARSGASEARTHAAAHLQAWRSTSDARSAVALHRQRRAAAAAAAAAGEKMLRIVPSTQREDLSAAAWLRAEAYYEVGADWHAT